MSRPLRIEYEGAWYHVMNRGVGRRDVFLNDTHREMFLELLDRFGVETHAYCLMSNHYHNLMHKEPKGSAHRVKSHLKAEKRTEKEPQRRNLGGQVSSFTISG